MDHKKSFCLGVHCGINSSHPSSVSVFGIHLSIETYPMSWTWFFIYLLIFHKKESLCNYAQHFKTCVFCFIRRDFIFYAYVSLFLYSIIAEVVGGHCVMSIHQIIWQSLSFCFLSLVNEKNLKIIFYFIYLLAVYAKVTSNFPRHYLSLAFIQVLECALIVSTIFPGNSLFSFALQTSSVLDFISRDIHGSLWQCFSKISYHNTAAFLCLICITCIHFIYTNKLLHLVS